MHKKQFSATIGFIRILSICGVVLIHSTTRTIEYNKFLINEITFTVLLNQIFRFAVPVLFIISGFILAEGYFSNQSYIIFIKKRLNKIFIPYLFWSVIYYYFVYNITRDKYLLHSLIAGNASYQLYFIPSLMILYSIFPLFFYLVKKYKLLFLITIFCIDLFLLYIDYFVKSYSANSPLYISILNMFPFVYGIYLSLYKRFSRKIFFKYKYVFYLSMIISAYVVFSEGFYGYLETSNYLYLYSQWRPSVLLFSILLFNILYFNIEGLKVNNLLIQKISNLTFFVYFVHVIMIEFFSLKYQFLINNNLLFFIIISILSFSLAFLTHRFLRLERLTG